MKMRFVLIVLLAFANLSCDTSNGVYICTGPRSRVYHKTSKCKGLRRCSGEIKLVSLDEAKRLHRRECRICFK